jgi:hypothetical protein
MAGMNGSTGVTGATGVTGPTGANGTGLTTVWEEGTQYSAGTLITYNHAIFLALATNTNITPGSSGADGIWAGIALGTGASPGGIPYTHSTHTINTQAEFISPVISGQGNTSVGALQTVLVPNDCTPSMTLYSYGPTGGVFGLYAVNPTSGGVSWPTTGSDLFAGACDVGGSSGSTPQKCSVTASSKAAAGTVLTISAPAQASGGQSGVFIYFSCF